jgi:hypothetical protein
MAGAASTVARLPGIGRLLQVLGVNSVPALGLFDRGWSSGTALAFYWIEGVLAMVFVAARIALHRRLTRKAGHEVAGQFSMRSSGRRAPVRSTGTFLGSYLGVAVPFTLAHGFFLAVLLFMFAVNRPEAGTQVDFEALRWGVAGGAIFLAVGFLFDLVGLGQRSFRWLEHLTERSLGRVFIVHLTIVFGMLATAWTDGPRGFFAVFVVLKTLSDLGGVLPDRELGLGPPWWLRWLDKLPARGGETFSAYWQRTETEARTRRAANERVLGDAPGAG